MILTSSDWLKLHDLLAERLHCRLTRAGRGTSRSTGVAGIEHAARRHHLRRQPTYHALVAQTRASAVILAHQSAEADISPPAGPACKESVSPFAQAVVLLRSATARVPRRRFV